MLLYFAVAAAALSAALLVVLVFQLLPQQSRAVQQRIQEVKILGSHDLAARDSRQRRRDKLRAILEEMGQKIESDEERVAHARLQLRQAGILGSGAASIYHGSKLMLAAALGFGSFLLVQMGASPILGLVISVYMGAVGWVAPTLWLRVRRTHRQRDLQKALPDALDLLVVCVEAGQGLNQALVRVSEEIGHVSLAMAMELSQVNFQIRAGTPRDLALNDLARNTGLPDLRSLVTMLIQTDRFGTSVAQALRVHADTMREKRRQRAEEAAAKTTIKLVFPLVICIFPALFVVILTPGLIEIIRTLGGL